MTTTTSGNKETRRFLEFTWEKLFVGFNFLIYAGCFVLALIPSISAETPVLFFFGSSMGLYIFFMFSAVIINLFFSPVQSKHRQRKTVSGLI